ncbi:MAG: 2Fe-2S iron-sulfur cluster-binding protein, partial [Aeoliella sp.]
MATSHVSEAKATIDGVTLSFAEGETILEFAERTASERNGAASPIPTLCYDPRLKPYGSCRVCSVEISASSNGPRRVVAACHT